jgi:hypothetical protein
MTTPSHPHPTCPVGAPPGPTTDDPPAGNALGTSASTEAEVVQLLLAVPELACRYLELAEDTDDDPGAAGAFAALADLLTDALDDAHRPRDLVPRALAAVERTARHAAEAEELVAWSFLDALPPDTYDQLAPSFGPATRRLAAALVEETVHLAEGEPRKGRPQ